jgi:hypothetical protein
MLWSCAAPTLACQNCDLVNYSPKMKLRSDSGAALDRQPTDGIDNVPTADRLEPRLRGLSTVNAHGIRVVVKQYAERIGARVVLE